jgi:hypothetical protein
MLRRLLHFLFLDRKARDALKRKPAAAMRPRRATGGERPRDPATALAEAEERMKRLPPEKAQLIRTALLVQMATRDAALSELSEEEVQRLADVARKTFLGPQG